jgi:dephospho-CoA kinase
MYPWGPSVKEIHRYRSKDDILRVIKHEMGKDVEAIRAEKGELRQIVMDVLYRAGGLKAPQIGRIFGLDYGSVSQERKRLREKLPKDRKLQALMSRIENSLSTSEI